MPVYDSVNQELHRGDMVTIGSDSAVYEVACLSELCGEDIVSLARPNTGMLTHPWVEKASNVKKQG